MTSNEMIKDPKKDRQKMFNDFYSSVTLHGFRYVVEEKGFRKIIWYILFFGSLAVSVMLFYGVTEDYFQYKTYVTINDFDYDKKDIPFPTVTICNKIPLVQQGFERVKKLVNVTEQQFEDFHLNYLTRYSKKFDWDEDANRRIFDMLERNNITEFIEVVKLFEMNKQDLLYSPLAAEFLTERGNGSKYPTSRYYYSYPIDTKETISWRENLCHQMNQYIPNKDPRLGWWSQKKRYNNLISVLDISTTRRINKTRNVRTTAPYMDLIEGVVLYIHPYGVPHQRPEYINRIFLQAGMWHFVKIDYTEMESLPKPFSTACGTKPYKMVKMQGSKKPLPYSKAMCILDCFLVKQYAKCGCIGWDFKELVEGLPVCNITQMKCFITKRGSVTNKCKDGSCPVECNKQRYSIKVEALDIRSDIVLERAMKIPNWEYNKTETMKMIKKNIVGIQVEYTSNAKVEVLSPAVTWNTLIGAIGGSIGLAMGLSILTLFEFIFFVFDYLLLWTNKRNQQYGVTLKDF